MLCLLAIGCNPNKPSEDDARASYQRHKKTLDRMESEIKKALEQFPYAGPRYRCADPKLPHADTKCLAAYQAWLKGTLPAVKAFRARMAVAWLDTGTVKSAKVVITRKSPQRPKVKGEASLAPKPTPKTWSFGCLAWRANRRDSTAPKNGFRVDGRQVGWGLGQLTFDSGKGKSYSDGGQYVPQIDVVWTFTHKEVTVTVEANILSQSQTPESWRRARKAACAPNTSP